MAVLKVSDAPPGAMLETISVSVFVVFAGSPNRPTIDSSAMIAGKTESRP